MDSQHADFFSLCKATIQYLLADLYDDIVIYSMTNIFGFK